MTVPLHKPSKENGAVLLTTLLVMGIMAVLAVAILDDLRVAVKRAGYVQDYAQTDWYVLGAQDFATSYLTSQLEQSDDPQLRNATLRDNAPIIFPLDGGAITLSVRDGSQCVVLSRMEDGPVRRQFRRLLTGLGWPQNEAAQITTLAVDWQDKDSQTLPGGGEDFTYLGRQPPYRTSNAPFATVSELRALDVFSEDQYQRLRPFLCTRPKGASEKININTLTVVQAPLIASLIDSDGGYDVATQLINERPEGGYTSFAQIQETGLLEDLEDGKFDSERLSYEPEFIWVEAEIRLGTAVRRAAFEFTIKGDEVSLLSRHFSAESFRPRLLETPS